MKIRLGSHWIRTPSGAEWRVGRLWTSRRFPRWRRIRFGQSAEDALDGAWYVSPVDVGSFDNVGVLLGGIVAAVVIAVIAIPLFLFGVELIVAGLVVATGIVARSALGRPWIVQAIPSADPSGALIWQVKGWRRSAQLIDEVAAELAAGLTPPPAENCERVTS